MIDTDKTTEEFFNEDDTRTAERRSKTVSTTSGNVDLYSVLLKGEQTNKVTYKSLKEDGFKNIPSLNDYLDGKIKLRKVEFKDGTTDQLIEEKNRLTDFYTKDEKDDVYNTLKYKDFDDYKQYFGLFSGSLIVEIKPNKYDGSDTVTYAVELDGSNNSPYRYSTKKAAKVLPYITETTIDFPVTDNHYVDWFEPMLKPTKRSMRNCIYRIEKINGKPYEDVKELVASLFRFTFDEYQLDKNGHKIVDEKTHRYILSGNKDEDGNAVKIRKTFPHSINLYNTGLIVKFAEDLCRLNGENFKEKYSQDGSFTLQFDVVFFLPNFVLETAVIPFYLPYEITSLETVESLKNRIENSKLDAKKIDALLTKLQHHQPVLLNDDYYSYITRADGSGYVKWNKYSFERCGHIVLPLEWINTLQLRPVKKNRGYKQYKISPVVRRIDEDHFFSIGWLFGDFERSLNDDKDIGSFVINRRPAVKTDFDEEEYDNYDN